MFAMRPTKGTADTCRLAPSSVLTKSARRKLRSHHGRAPSACQARTLSAFPSFDKAATLQAPQDLKAQKSRVPKFAVMSYIGGNGSPVSRHSLVSSQITSLLVVCTERGLLSRKQVQNTGQVMLWSQLLQTQQHSLECEWKSHGACQLLP